MTSGEIVRVARERRGLSAKELAERAKVTPQAISHIENDRVSPRMDTMLTIMRALGYEIVFKEKYKGVKI